MRVLQGENVLFGSGCGGTVPEWEVREQGWTEVEQMLGFEQNIERASA
jgi:hypothetical protein